MHNDSQLKDNSRRRRPRWQSHRGLSVAAVDVSSNANVHPSSIVCRVPLWAFRNLVRSQTNRNVRKNTQRTDREHTCRCTLCVSERHVFSFYPSIFIHAIPPYASLIDNRLDYRHYQMKCDKIFAFSLSFFRSSLSLHLTQ